MKLHTMFSLIDSVAEFEQASAHCDVPCSIYDPAPAQIAALTVLRMVDLMQELEKNVSERDSAFLNTFSRYVAAKENHAALCKHEINVIWGDSFKSPQFEKFPEIHEVTHTIMMLASRCKQNIDRDAALQLVETVNRFSEIFWETKNVKTKRVVCPYPPSVEVVYPDL